MRKIGRMLIALRLPVGTIYDAREFDYCKRENGSLTGQTQRVFDTMLETLNNQGGMLEIHFDKGNVMWRRCLDCCGVKWVDQDTGLCKTCGVK